MVVLMYGKIYASFYLEAQISFRLSSFRIFFIQFKWNARENVT